MTRKIYSAVMAGAAVLAATAGATSANAATASSPARARVMSAITLANARQLDFGAIIAGAAAGTVDIDSTGARNCTGVTCSGATSSSLFNITTGTPAAVLDVVADASVTLTAAGGATMTATLTESASTVTLDAAGAGSFTVGGSLGVAANQAQGTYTGSFNVSANYQ